MTTIAILKTVAVGFGLISVYLNARQNVMGWATGLVNVGLYSYLFFKDQLFALMGLQVFFFVISLYGWYHWLRGGETRKGLPVTSVSVAMGLGLTAVAAGGSLGLGWALDRFTPGQEPYLDSSISVVSMRQVSAALVTVPIGGSRPSGASRGSGPSGAPSVRLKCNPTAM